MVGDPHEVFLPGLNAIQYKSGKLTKLILEKEFKKPGVQQALKNGGAYLLLVGHDYVATTADKHLKTLLKLCKARRIPAERVRIVFGGALGRWISRYPAVAALHELGQKIREFITVATWRAGNKQMRNPFKPDALRRETIQRVQEFLDSDAGDSVLRLEGPAGVGKTRLALEAVSDPKYESRTLYASNAENAEVQPFLSAIYSHSEKIAIAVTGSYRSVYSPTQSWRA